jgi:hypothetical protein
MNVEQMESFRINSVGLKDELRNGIWVECAVTTTYLHDVNSSLPKLDLYLKILGQMGIVRTKD